MARIRSIFIIFLLPLAAAVLAALYFLLYRAVVNRRLRRGETGKRRLLSPAAAAALLLAGAVLAAGAALLMWNVLPGTNGALRAGTAGTYDFVQLTQADMQTEYRAGYSIDGIAGYEKTVRQDGDVRFTVFASGAAYDRLHPMYVVYVTYTGTEEVEEAGYAARFLTGDGQELCGEAAAGGLEESGYQCFFISADTPCTLRLETAYFDPAGARRLKIEGEADGASPELMQRCAAAYGTLELFIEP